MLSIFMSDIFSEGIRPKKSTFEPKASLLFYLEMAMKNY